MRNCKYCPHLQMMPVSLLISFNKKLPGIDEYLVLGCVVNFATFSSWFTVSTFDDIMFQTFVHFIALTL